MLIDFLDDLLYTVFKPNFECFRKVRCFAKFFYEKGRPPASFFDIPCAADWILRSGQLSFFLILFSLCRSSGHEKSAGICPRFQSQDYSCFLR